MRTCIPPPVKARFIVTPMLGRQRQRVLGAYWPDRPAQSVRSKLVKDPISKKQGGGAREMAQFTTVTPVTPVPGDPMSFSDLHGLQGHMWCTHPLTHKQNT